MRRQAFFALTVFSFATLVSVGCLQNFDVFTEPGAGGSSSSSSSGMGGCSSVLDCDDKNECTTDACSNNTCTNTPVANGPAPSDKAGDCKKLTCQGGQLSTTIDDNDVVNDMNECTTETCNNGMLVSGNVAADTPCGMGATTKCDGMGHCKGCGSPQDCPAPGMECRVADCVNMQCEVKNSPEAAPCNMGMDLCDQAGACVECLTDGNCTANPSDICVGGACVSSCGDNVKSGNETGVDCGGPCPNCPAGEMCMGDGDCISNDCVGGVCQPSCFDNEKNGDETDVDCGGSCNANCAVGEGCSANNDCQTNHCFNNVCFSCQNNTKDGDETGIDCGGSCPNNCANGEMCVNNNDCISNDCTGGICQPSCFDNQMNGGETDVDCGGPVCATKCALGEKCLMNSDCAATLGCEPVVNLCFFASCLDGTKNNNETDVDCGGNTCHKCGAGKTCSNNGDCISNMCTGNPKTCN